MKQITPQQAQEIINIACTDWKSKLAKIWATDMVLGQNIHISPEFYQQMRTHCTREQHNLFDQIFGKDFKAGDWVTITQAGTLYIGRTFQLTQEMIDRVGKGSEYDFIHPEYSKYRIPSQARIATLEEIMLAKPEITLKIGRRYKLKYSEKFCNWHGADGKISTHLLSSKIFTFIGTIDFGPNNSRSIFVSYLECSYLMMDVGTDYIVEEVK